MLAGRLHSPYIPPPRYQVYINGIVRLHADLCLYHVTILGHTLPPGHRCLHIYPYLLSCHLLLKCPDIENFHLYRLPPQTRKVFLSEVNLWVSLQLLS